MVDTQDLNPSFKQALDAMIAASGGRLRVTSGYRDNDLQAKLYAEAVKKYGPSGAGKWVAPPGHSNHNRGLAADLAGDLGWAHANAARFGLVFPMSWENWHIEPVHARDSASPQAYTQDPNGVGVNPTEDAGWMQQPDKIAALISGGLQAAQAGVGAPTEDSGTQGATSGDVTPEQVYKALRAQGIDAVHAAALTAIAGRESGYKTAAYNGNHATGDESHGLFQINLLNGGWGPTLQKAGVDPSQLGTLEGSAKAAKVLLGSSGLTPWGGYRGDVWSKGTNLQAAVAASGGEVTLEQLQGLS